MPRNRITKDEIKAFVLSQKQQLNNENIGYTSDPKGIANRYINNILDKIEEFRF